MRRALLPFALLIAGGCTTTRPLAPDPSIDLHGEWRVVAINQKPTGGDESFWLKVAPPQGSAQFGCNSGGGPVATGNGWLVPGDSWIMTVAGCLPRKLARFERQGFDVLSEPAAIERTSAGLRLRNAKGSIDLVRPPPLAAAKLVGNWAVDAINGVATPGGATFRVAITARELDGRFGCNRYSGEYVVEDGRYRPLMARTTEMACEWVDPKTGRPFMGAPVMTVEEWAFDVLRSRPEIKLQTHGRMSLVGPQGSIDLRRIP